MNLHTKLRKFQDVIPKISLEDETELADDKESRYKRIRNLFDIKIFPVNQQREDDLFLPALCENFLTVSQKDQVMPASFC